MNRRLQQFLELEQLSNARFADMMGIQRSSVTHLLSGRNKPGYDFLSKFAIKFPQINIEWLITGKGKPYKENAGSTPSDNSATPDNLFDENFIFGQEHEQGPEYENVETPVTETKTASRKTIKRITIFYSDGSFDEFFPNR